MQALAYGTYDGIAGLFTQPVTGAMEEGPLGFVKGVGKGVVGMPFKFWDGTSPRLHSPRWLTHSI
jgi:hypothetical protein